ncbi:MAG TPA: hypothetical protein VH062_18385 [Polyangiaceae bacterium]|jgi:hypothetical protein|nr:hypothetical protein [Polyangiaceae bacterium]
MTVSLARRLTWEGVVAPEDANDALYRHVTERVSFLQGLVERHPELAETLESELGSSGDPRAASITADPALLESLPPGFALAFAALPVRRDPATSVVEVVAANPTDAHLASELSYHLGAPVEVRAAPLRAVLAALAKSTADPVSRRHTPAFGTGAPLPDGGLLRPSERPIPLVRRSIEPAPPSTIRHGSLAPPAPVETRPAHTKSLAPLPIISLTSTRPLGTPSAPARPSSFKAAPAAPEPGAPPPAALLETDETALDALGHATNADEVVTALLAGLRRVASTVVVFAAKAKNFEGKDASDAKARDAVRALSIPVDRPSILQTAVQALGYVGPIPSTPVHDGLMASLGNPAGEVAAGAVMVSGRAALVYVAAGLVTTYLATRRADQLTEAAGKALSRIVRDRKK